MSQPISSHAHQKKQMQTSKIPQSNRILQKTSWTVFTLNSVQPLLTQLKGQKSVDSKEYLLFYSEAKQFVKNANQHKTNAQVINNKVIITRGKHIYDLYIKGSPFFAFRKFPVSL